MYVVFDAIFMHTQTLPLAQLSASMDKCQSQFTSKETGASVADTERMLKNLEELKMFIEQAAEVVQSHGKKLLELVVQTPVSKTKSSSLWQSPQFLKRSQTSEVQGVMTLNRTPRSRQRNFISTESHSSTPKPSRATVVDMNTTSSSKEDGERFVSKPLVRASSLDFLDSNGSESVPEDSDSTVSSRLECPRSPRLLVNPRKAGVKSSLSMTNVASPNDDQLMIEGVLRQMESRSEQLRELWEARQRRLRQSLKVVEFREAVPVVMNWVEQVGNKFLEGRNNLGRSIEEVKMKFFKNSVVLIAKTVLCQHSKLLSISIGLYVMCYELTTQFFFI